MHQESVRELIVVLLGGHVARDSLVVAVLMLAALLNTKKWEREEERQGNLDRQKGTTSLEGKAHRGKRTHGTRLLYRQTGPDGLRVRQPAELVNPAAQQFTASSQTLREEARRSRQEYREKKGLRKIYYPENLMISEQRTRGGNS